MAKSKLELLAMLKNELVELAKTEGVRIKPYWPKSKIASEILKSGKTYSAKKEGIAKDFKKRWMELSDDTTKPGAGEIPKTGAEPPKKKPLAIKPQTQKLPTDEELRKELLSETVKIEAFMAKELIDMGVNFDEKKGKEEKKK